MLENPIDNQFWPFQRMPVKSARCESIRRCWSLAKSRDAKGKVKAVRKVFLEKLLSFSQGIWTFYTNNGQGITGHNCFNPLPLNHRIRKKYVSYMLESFLTGETYRDSKDPILTELHMVEVEQQEKRMTVKMGACYFLEQ